MSTWQMQYENFLNVYLCSCLGLIIFMVVVQVANYKKDKWKTREKLLNEYDKEVLKQHEETRRLRMRLEPKKDKETIWVAKDK